MTPPAGSITRLIPDLLDRDEVAIGELWRRYVGRMEAVARPVMVGLAPGAGDEQDVAQSAYFAFCEAAANGLAPNLESRNELWRLLSTIVRHKATDHVRRESRARRGGRGAASVEEFQDVADRYPSPPQVAQLQEAVDTLFEKLDSASDPKLKAIAILRLEGAAMQEIADRLDCTVRTVQRKLHILERLWWERNN